MTFSPTYNKLLIGVFVVYGGKMNLLNLLINLLFPRKGSTMNSKLHKTLLEVLKKDLPKSVTSSTRYQDNKTLVIQNVINSCIITAENGQSSFTYQSFSSNIIFEEGDLDDLAEELSKLTLKVDLYCSYLTISW